MIRQKRQLRFISLMQAGQARCGDADLQDVILPSIVVGHSLPTAVQIHSGCWAFSLGFRGINVYQNGAKSRQQALEKAK